MSLGLKIKRLRQRLGLTQRQVASRLRLSRSAVANFENGHRKISEYYRKQLTRLLRRG